MFDYKLEYYLYNREEDKYTYHYNFQELYKAYTELDSHEKYLGVTIIDEYGSTMEEDILFSHEE